MKKHEKELLLSIIDGCQITLGNRTCDDFDYPDSIEISHQEKRQILKEFHDLNGDPREFLDHSDSYCGIQESSLLWLLKEKLKKSAILEWANLTKSKAVKGGEGETLSVRTCGKETAAFIRVIADERCDTVVTIGDSKYKIRSEKL